VQSLLLFQGNKIALSVTLFQFFVPAGREDHLEVVGMIKFVRSTYLGSPTAFIR
jgi:hypothetical protein